MAGESGCNEGVRSCSGVDGAEVRSWMTCVSCVRVGVATDFTSVSYDVLPFLVFFHLVVVGRILPPAGLRPRLGLEPGGRGALTTLVTMALRTLRISSESVGSPGGTEGFVNSVVLDFFRPQFLHHTNFVAESLSLPEESLLHSAF